MAETKGIVPVRLEQQGGQRVGRAFAILKDRVETRAAVRLVEAPDDPQIVLAVSQDPPEERFQIDSRGRAVQIAGGSLCGLIYGHDLRAMSDRRPFPMVRCDCRNSRLQPKLTEAGRWPPIQHVHHIQRVSVTIRQHY